MTVAVDEVGLPLTLRVVGRRERAEDAKRAMRSLRTAQPRSSPSTPHCHRFSHQSLTASMTPTPSRPHRTALIQYPTSQSYILDSLRVAFNQLPHWTLYTNRAQLEEKSPDLQWSDYDELDWDAAAQEDHLLNSYAIRKGCVQSAL